MIHIWTLTLGLHGFIKIQHKSTTYKSHILVATATALPPELPPGTSQTSSSTVLLQGGDR